VREFEQARDGGTQLVERPTVAALLRRRVEADRFDGGAFRDDEERQRRGCRGRAAA
jgi:hypothetical protein